MLHKKALKMSAYNLSGKFIINRVCEAQETIQGNLLKRVGVLIRSNKDKDKVQTIFWHGDPFFFHRKSINILIARLWHKKCKDQVEYYRVLVLARSKSCISITTTQK